MGQGGRIVLYTEAPIKDRAAATLRTVESLGTERVLRVCRTPWTDKAWAIFQLRRQGRDKKADLLDNETWSTETVIKRVSVDDLHRWIGPRIEGYLGINNSCALTLVSEAVKNSISENIRGEYWPMEVYIHARDQDIWTVSPYPDGKYYGRATFSVEFFGYGVAKQTGVCDEMLLALPEVQQVKANLETILGPLKQCVIWDV